MRIDRDFAACSLLLVFAVPLAAAPPAAAPPAAPPSPAPLPQQSVLDGLVGKHRVIGFTERGGRKFLGRVLSADHGLYVVQTFHYTSTPATVTETVPQTTYRTGRNGRVRPVPRQVKTRETTPKTLADATAVRALLSGVAGPSFVPSEQPAQREIIAPANVTYLQELVPPVPAAAAAPKTTTAAPKTASPGWTLKTLWASPDLPHPKTTK